MTQTGSAGVELLNHVQTSELFRAVDNASLQQVADSFEWLEVPAGEHVFQQGATCDAMYIIVSGVAQAAITQQDGRELIVGMIRAGEPIGEMEILTGDNFVASVRATESLKLIKISRQALSQLIRKNPDTLKEMGAFISQRVRRNQLLEVLYQVFGNRGKQYIEELEARMEWVHLLSGEVLMRAGDAGDSMFLLISGRLQVMATDEHGTEHYLAEVNPGASIGEMELLYKEPRAASVYACRDSSLVKLSRRSCFLLVQKYPELMAPIMRVVTDRLRSQNQARTGRESASTARGIALVPAGRQGEVLEFAQRIARVLMSKGGSLILSSEIVDSLMGMPGMSMRKPEDPESIRLTVWLNGQEARHKFLLYVADPTPTEWTRRCIRQADHVLVVGSAGDDPSLGSIESELLYREQSVRIPQSLVLLHPQGTDRPSGTQAWLRQRQVKMHHHVRRGNHQDVARLVRFLVGEAVGLVLGGGAARGFAHMGVIRALEEAGIPIDVVGGTSVGGIVGASYALGWDHQTMMREIPRATKIAFSGFTVPVVSLMSPRNADNVIQELTEDVFIEDLWRQFYCVSSNLTRAEVMVHRTGLLRNGLRATTRVPGILPPVSHQGDLLVDGGLLDNVPMDIMRDLCGSGTVIAVDVTPSISAELVAGSQGDESVSTWDVLRKTVNPFSSSPGSPHIAAILRRSVELGCVHTIQKSVLRNAADLYLMPPLGQFAVTKFGGVDEIERVGYEHTKEKIAAWHHRERLEGIA